MNFSAISVESAAGKVLRLPLKLIPRNATLRIWQGALKGKKWIVGSHTHGCWLGSYEHDKQVLFNEMITRNSVVLDIGSNVGFYTLLASELVGPEGHVYAFEPVPRNLSYLNEHLRINHVTNVTVFEAAVSDARGVRSFTLGASSAMGHLSPIGEVEVETVMLDDLIARGIIRSPQCLKIDVEGDEMQVLVGAKSLLHDSSPDILLATHGRELHKQCCDLLTGFGYELQSLDDRSVAETDELVARGIGKRT